MVDHGGRGVGAMKAEVQLRREPDHRRDARHAAQYPGEVASGSEAVVATVTDLSRSGCRVVIAEALQPDSVIWLKVGGHGPVMARVVWYDGTAAGCEFAGKLHPDVVDSLLAG
jgi:hypothetical protein